MSSGARSVLLFGTYMVAAGVMLVVAPNAMLGLFALSETTEVWVRIVGMLTLFLGACYIQAGRREMSEFFRWTVYLRLSANLFFVAFVALGLAPAVLILFGVVDLVGAVWTILALRAQPRA